MRLCYWGLLVVCCAVAMAPAARAQSTAFSYQGVLAAGAQPADGTYDFQFRLFDALIGGTETETPRERLNVLVSNGLFTVPVDFGAGAFPGADRFLEIGVRPTGGGSFTTLVPRQPITLAPYAIRSASASYADSAINATFAQNATNAQSAQTAQSAATAGSAATAQTAQDALNLGGVAASQYVLTGDPRLSDARAPTAGSVNYIQNSSAQQAASNFSISGNGTAAGTLTGNILSATTQFNIGAARVLSSPGPFNFFAGLGAGATNTTGTSNSFFGVNAGIFNKTGGSNTFAGFEAGRNNDSGARNSYFGRDAGRSGATGNDNAFFGFEAGQNNLAGSGNSFFGRGAGLNTTDTGNSFLGRDAGNTNTTGSNNTVIGTDADVGATFLTNASAIGYQALVGTSNALVLGSVSGENGATADINVGIGTTTPTTPLEIEGELTRPIIRVTNFGRYSVVAGRSSLGTRSAPTASLADQALFILGADGHTGSAFGTNSAATIQFNSSEDWTSTANGTSILFATTTNGTTDRNLRMRIEDNGFVGIGALAPARRLDVDGTIRVGSTTGTIGCVEDRGGTVIAGTCASDVRFKRNITPFGNVLESVSKLRPVNFYWRSDEFRDSHFGSRQSFGLIAQEVEEVLPELVSEDEAGFKAVNYSKLPLLTLQAVRELKAENDRLRGEIEAQGNQRAARERDLQAQIDELKRAVRWGEAGH